MLSFLSLLVLPTVYSYRRPHHLLNKRVSTGDNEFTFYDPGLGACGVTNSGSDFVVAMNVPEFNHGASCNKEITIIYNGKTAKAQVVDECVHCAFGGLDLSRGLFNFFADESEGVIHGDWSYGDSTPQPEATSAKQTTATTLQTSTSISETVSTTFAATTRSSTSVPSLSTTATSSAATASSSPRVMVQFSNSLIYLIELVVQEAEANAR